MREIDDLKTKLVRLTRELVGGCPYCVSVSSDPECNAPVFCTKWSGSAHPVGVNPATCLSCGEYRGAAGIS